MSSTSRKILKNWNFAGKRWSCVFCICILSRGAGKAWLDLRITPAAARHRLHAHALNPGLGPQHHNQHHRQEQYYCQWLWLKLCSEFFWTLISALSTARAMTKHYVCQSLSDVQQSTLRRTSRESEPWACLQPSTSLQPHPWNRTLTLPQINQNQL